MRRELCQHQQWWYEIYFLNTFFPSSISLILAMELNLKMHYQGLKAATSMLVLHKKLFLAAACCLRHTTPTTCSWTNNFFPFFDTKAGSAHSSGHWKLVDSGPSLPLVSYILNCFYNFPLFEGHSEHNAEKSWISNIVYAIALTWYIEFLVYHISKLELIVQIKIALFN